MSDKRDFDDCVLKIILNRKKRIRRVEKGIGDMPNFINDKNISQGG